MGFYTRNDGVLLKVDVMCTKNGGIYARNDGVLLKVDVMCTKNGGIYRSMLETMDLMLKTVVMKSCFDSQ